jgi:hypothetical protein
MRAAAFMVPLLLVAACGNAGQSQPATTKENPKESMLPDRLLTCTLGRALNLDPSRKQTVADVKYEGRYPFALFLPAAPVRQTPPPDPTELPEPVNPKTRIVSDPNGLTKDVPAGFDRVVDIWPERVELARTIVEPLTHLIIISDVDTRAATANLFMATATDAATFDLTSVFSGQCKVTAGES